jgi:hypothetical protein
MITRDDEDVEYLTEVEYEALVQAATTLEDDKLEDQEQVLCVDDTSPSLVVTKVLTTQAHPNATSSKQEPKSMENLSKSSLMEVVVTTLQAPNYVPSSTSNSGSIHILTTSNG